MKMKLYPVLYSDNKVCGFHWDYEFQYLDEVTYGDLVEIEVDDEQLKKALDSREVKDRINLVINVPKELDPDYEPELNLPPPPEGLEYHPSYLDAMRTNAKGFQHIKYDGPVYL